MEELFKSLSESVSEACFDDILNIVEDILNEYTEADKIKAAKNSIPGRQKEFDKAFNNFNKVISTIPTENILTGRLTPVQKYRQDKANNVLVRAQGRLQNAEEIAAQEKPKGAAAKKRLKQNSTTKLGA